jgi:hypothetical protein
VPAARSTIRLPTSARRGGDVILVALLGLGGAWYLGKFDDLVPDAITSVSVLGGSAPRAKRQAEAAAATAAAAAATQKATTAPALPAK